MRDFFRKYGLKVEGFISKNIKQYDIFGVYSGFSDNENDFFKQNENRKIAYLCFLSLKTLYDIDEFWNHYISILKDNIGIIIYDSFFPIAKTINPHIDYSIYENLPNLKMICLKIYYI